MSNNKIDMTGGASVPHRKAETESIVEVLEFPTNRIRVIDDERTGMTEVCLTFESRPIQFTNELLGMLSDEVMGMGFTPVQYEDAMDEFFAALHEQSFLNLIRQARKTAKP